jgi:hypothetical protein
VTIFGWHAQYPPLSQVDQPRLEHREIDAEQLGHLGVAMNRRTHQQFEKTADRRCSHGANVRINAVAHQSIFGMSDMHDEAVIATSRSSSRASRFPSGTARMSIIATSMAAMNADKRDVDIVL